MPESRVQNADPYMAKVGTISAAWAVLELNFESAASKLVGGDPEALTCVMAQMPSHYPKLKAVVALCKYRGISPARIKELNAFSGSLNDLSERRNRAIHDPWLMKGGKIVGRHTPGKFREPAAASIQELTDLHRAIVERIDKFQKIKIAILNELESLQRRRP